MIVIDEVDKPLVLIVEDEPDLGQLLRDYLLQAGYQTLVIANGIDAEKWLSTNSPSLIILDLMLPGKAGLEICKKFRMRSNTPIIITSAKVEEIDRLIGLELGADDYICKPYSPREVVARVKTVLRRMETSRSPTTDQLTIDDEKLSVSAANNTIPLTHIELRLLKLLHSQPGRIYSRQFIMDNIYTDYRVVSDRTVDSHIKKLRKKLHQLMKDREVIHSIYGAGYKFEIN